MAGSSTSQGLGHKAAKRAEAIRIAGRSQSQRWVKSVWVGQLEKCQDGLVVSAVRYTGWDSWPHSL